MILACKIYFTTKIKQITGDVSKPKRMKYPSHCFGLVFIYVYIAISLFTSYKKDAAGDFASGLDG